MGRWEPEAQARLRAAATALFDERGYAQTTVAEIAERAGLTARTFFRYFADKREVLFAGSERLEQVMVEAVLAAPAADGPLAATGAALAAAGAWLGGDPEHSRRRQAVIAANAELQERELIKMSSLAAALDRALRERGVGAPDAQLAAEAAITVFRVAFARWLSEPDRDLAAVMAATAVRLGELSAP